LTCPAVSNHSTDSEQVVIYTVAQCATPANINKVEDLTLRKEDEPRKQFAMENCATD